MKKNIILLVFFLVCLNAFGNDLNSFKMPAHTRAKLFFVEQYNKNDDAFLGKNQVQYPYSIKSNKLFVDLLIKISNDDVVNDLRSMGCLIITKAGSILGVSAPTEKISEILNHKNVIALEHSQLRKLNLDESVKSMRASGLYNPDGIPPYYSLNGYNTIVGIFDTGIDIKHPDFYYNDSHFGGEGTKILKLWDMSDTIKGMAPEGYEYGREYTKKQIDETPEQIIQRDYNGHGTHVAGIAAGSGNADINFKGVAYAADLVIVKGTRSPVKSNFSDIDIIAGCEYIFKEAEKFKKPAVINLSLGTPIGPHDGKSLLAIALSELTGKGKIIVASAGNSGEMPIHTGGSIEAGEFVELPIYPQNICEIFEDFCPDVPNFFMTAADAWYSDIQFDSLQIYLYKSNQFGFEIANTITISTNSAFENKYFANDKNEPLAFISFVNNPNYAGNGDGNFSIYIHNGGQQEIRINEYIWSIGLKSKTAGKFDMWAAVPIPGAFPFKPLKGSKYFTGNTNMTVGSPGDGDSIISVASHVSKKSWIDKDNVSQTRPWVVGALSTYSSLGPDRNGRMLPMISAPGQVIFAPKSQDFINPVNSQILLGDNFIGMNGTSMSAPHVTGMVSIMLMINPELSFYQIKDCFSSTAVKDSFTGPDNNNRFGYGKIDGQNIIDYLLKPNSVDYFENNDIRTYPNPAKELINIEISNIYENSRLNLYNINGQLISENVNFNILDMNEKSKIELNVSNLKQGVYIGEIISESHTSKFRFIKIGK